jgi:hypothetical protein
VFNSLTPAEVVTAIGLAARRAARSEAPSGDFERDQLMSAYSATRHLAGELAGYGPEWERFRAAVAERLSAAAAGEDLGRRLRAGAVAVEREEGTAAVGAALAELLADLRSSDDPAAAGVRADIRGLLRELAAREVDLLADALA